MIFLKRIEHVIAGISNELIFKNKCNRYEKKHILYYFAYVKKTFVNNSNVKKKAILFEKLFKYVDIIYQNILLNISIYIYNLF